MGPNQLAHDGRVVQRGVKGLVPPPLSVVYVLANDLPFALDESGFSEDLVGMTEAIEDESGFVSVGLRAYSRIVSWTGGVTYSWVRPSLSVMMSN